MRQVGTVGCSTGVVRRNDAFIALHRHVFACRVSGYVSSSLLVLALLVTVRLVRLQAVQVTTWLAVQLAFSLVQSVLHVGVGAVRCVTSGICREKI